MRELKAVQNDMQLITKVQTLARGPHAPRKHQWRNQSHFTEGMRGRGFHKGGKRLIRADKEHERMTPKSQKIMLSKKT